MVVILACLLTAPTLEAAAPIIDCGEILAGAPLERVFALTNRSTNPVNISVVNVSCGCSSHQLSQQTLAPGETTKLVVRINTLAQAAGPWSWSATVAAGGERLTLKLIGSIKREISVTPPGLAVSLESGTTTHEIDLIDTRIKPLTVRGISVSSSCLKAGFSVLKPGHVRISATIQDNIEPGEHREQIVLATDDTIYSELRIPVTVSRKPPRRVGRYPPHVDFSDRGERVLLRRADGKPLEIAECIPPHADISVSWSKGAGSVATISLKVLGGRGQGELRVLLREPAGELLTIPLRWGD